MPTYVGYARQTRHGPPLSEQVEKLHKAGVVDRLLFKDVLPKAKRAKTPTDERDDCIRSIRKGETLVLPSMDRLGTDLRDVLDQIVKLSEKNAGLVVVDAGFDYPVNQMPAIQFAEMVLSAERVFRTENTRKARKAAKLMGRTGGRPASAIVADPKKNREAKADWRNPDLSQREVARRHKTSPRTLRRLFGEKLLSTDEE